LNGSEKGLLSSEPSKAHEPFSGAVSSPFRRAGASRQKFLPPNPLPFCLPARRRTEKFL